MVLTDGTTRVAQTFRLAKKERIFCFLRETAKIKATDILVGHVKIVETHVSSSDLRFPLAARKKEDKRICRLIHESANQRNLLPFQIKSR